MRIYRTCFLSRNHKGNKTMGEDIGNYKEHMEELEEAMAIEKPDFEKDTRIDELALDVEWLNQTSLAAKYTGYAIELQRAVKLMDLAVKEERAKLYIAVSGDPVRWTGKEKPTVGLIEAVIDTDEKYSKMKTDLIKLEADADHAEKIRREICVTRKNTLENLVTLHGQNYFAGPKVPRDIGREATERMKQDLSNKQVAEANRKNKK